MSSGLFAFVYQSGCNDDDKNIQENHYFKSHMFPFDLCPCGQKRESFIQIHLF